MIAPVRARRSPGTVCGAPGSLPRPCPAPAPTPPRPRSRASRSAIAWWPRAPGDERAAVDAPPGRRVDGLPRGAREDWAALVRRACAVSTFAIELSALSEGELPGLVAFLAERPRLPFHYLSVHAPTKQRTLPDARLVAELAQLPPHVDAIVVHPDQVAEPAAWRPLGRRLVLREHGRAQGLGPDARGPGRAVRRAARRRLLLRRRPRRRGRRDDGAGPRAARRPRRSPAPRPPVLPADRARRPVDARARCTAATRRASPPSCAAARTCRGSSRPRPHAAEPARGARAGRRASRCPIFWARASTPRDAYRRRGRRSAA